MKNTGFRFYRLTFASLLYLFVCNAAAAQDFSDLKNQKPFTFTGSMEARGIFYNASGIPGRRSPFNYYLNGSPTLSVYGLDIPVSFSISEADRSFRQPFNQFGMSPTYKWITLHAGYRNISFSPYTLAGHTMLGAGFELNPGKLRLGFMYGRLNRATTIDTTTQALVPFSFSRKGYAAKLGYGSSANFFEFSYLSAHDDNQLPDGLNPLQNTVSPGRNQALGYSTRFLFFKKISFESDAAVSLYTDDINSPLALTFDNKILEKLQSTFGANATTSLFTALSAALGYKAKNYGFKVSYKRIDPDFKTMGAYYFNSDLENWTVNPSFSLFKGKFRFNGSLGLQHDNIKKQKLAENKRVIGSVNTSAEITKQLGIDVIYTNFSDNQKARTVLFADSIKIVQTTQTFGIMPRYFISTPNVTHAISGAANLSSLRDFNNFFSNEAVSRNISTRQFFLNYNLSFPKGAWSVFMNLNHTSLSGAGLNSTFAGATLGGNMAFFKQQLQTGLSSSFTKSNGGSSNRAFILNSSFNLMYKFDKHQNLGFNFYLVKNTAKGLNLIQPDFVETRGELSYALNF